MRWQLQELGFLPNQEPATRLTHFAFQGVERLATDLPRLVQAGTFRAASAGYIDRDATVPRIDEPASERLFMLFSYFASAYVHSPGLPPVSRLPAYIAAPLVRASELFERPPILSYASYCLHNWRRIDRSGPVALGNIALLQNFSMPGDGKADEDWFILVHVDIEARAGAALSALRAAGDPMLKDDSTRVETLLATARDSLQAMNRTMARMPEGCSPDVYFKKVRPYIFGFNDIVYEGSFGHAPQTFRGETGAQSSIIPTMLRAFGITHKNSLLTKHLEDMQTYMPRPHRDFINAQASIRDVALRGPGRIKELYNACLTEIIAFRTKHFEYAVNYIEKKVDNPIATGGTPYVPWLRQLIEETTEFYI